MASPLQGYLDLQLNHIPPTILPALPAGSHRRQRSRSSASAVVQHADVQALLEANESLHQQLMLALQRLAQVYYSSNQRSQLQESGLSLPNAHEVSEDIARWESGAPTLLRADGTLQNDNAKTIEVEFSDGPLGLLFRSAPEDTGYALEVHEFVDTQSKRRSKHEQQQVIPREQWQQQHSNASVIASSTHTPVSDSRPALQRGMVLTAIQGRDLFRVSQDTVGDMLEAAPRPVVLKFALLPLSSLRRAYQALRSRLTTLQVRVEVMQSSAQQREHVFQTELGRLKANLRTMAAAWRQASASASGWERSARRAWAELDAARAQIASLEKRVPAPQDRLKASLQREGTAPRGVWSPDGLTRQSSAYTGAAAAGSELAGGAFRDLDAPRRAKLSVDSTFIPPPSVRGRASTHSREDMPPPDIPLLRSQSSVVHDDTTHMTRAMYAGTAVGDSLLLLKSRLSQLAWERDSALRAMADSQEQLMAAQEHLRNAEEKNRDLQDEVRDMHLRSDALSRLTSAGEAEQAFQEQYLVKLAQNNFVRSEADRPDWGAALAAMRTLWSDFAATLKQNAALRQQLQQGDTSRARLNEAVAVLKHKLIALRAKKKRSGELNAPAHVPTAKPAPKPAPGPKAAQGKGSSAPKRPSPPSSTPSTAPASAQAGPTPSRAAAAPAPPSPAKPPAAATPPRQQPAPPAPAPAKQQPDPPTARGTAPAGNGGVQPTKASAMAGARRAAEAAELERVSALASKLVHGSDVVLQGAMSKRSRSGPTKRWSRWVSRYVRLNRGLLSYYTDDQETRPKGTIPVASMKQVAVCPAGSTGKHQSVFHCFMAGGKEVQLSAGSADECATWRQVLGEATVLSTPAAQSRPAGAAADSDGTDSDASV